MLKKLFKYVGLSFLILLIAVGLVYGGFYWGSTEAQKHVINITDSRQIINSDFSIFWKAVQLIKDKYYNIKDVKDQDLLYGAIRGVAGALGDPYSVFFKPSDAKKFAEDINGTFGGIGAEIGIRNNQLMIISPLKGNPAEAAGLKALDQILKIDDTLTNDLIIDEAVKLIRGEPGTQVKLLIFRNGWKEAKEFIITRQTIVVPTLDWEMKSGGILYIHLYNFNTNASPLFGEAVFSGMLKGARGMILDLRNNPGGFLEVAVDIAGWFLHRGDVVVQEKFQSGERKLLKANGNEVLAEAPMVILVNSGSASASEILAGALRDKRHLTIIGEKTFGKGTVQEVNDLEDGSALKVSIAEWLTPNGLEINKKGIEPDIEVKMTDDDVANNRDPQLDKALEVIRQML